MNSLEQHLQALENSDRYRVDAVLKSGDVETTERVFLRTAEDGGAPGERNAAPSEQGPFIRKTISRDAGLGASYQRLWEAQNAGTRFVHLPQIISFWQDAERIYVVMEHVPGTTLDHWISDRGAGPEAASQLFRSICEGIAELHQRFNPPIIHRDIKPSNIMISAGHVTIIDLGISRTFDSDATQDTKHFGTRAYAPPEQYGFGQTDQRSDVYALGMLLYFLLTGESAHDTGARTNGFANPAVSPVMQDVLMTATAFDPEQRFVSVEALFQAFLNAGGEQTEPAPAATTSAPAAPAPHPAPAATTPVPAAPTPHPIPEPYRVPEPYPVPKPSRGSARFATSQKATPTSNRFSLLGKVWNVLLLLDLLFWACICANTALNPTDKYVNLPLAYRSFLYGSMWLLLFAPLTYVLMDKRRLRERFEFLAKLRGWKLAFFTVLCVIALFLIIGFGAPA